jgi:hypothetical protein
LIRPLLLRTCVRMEPVQLTPRRQGDLGEAAAIAWFARVGAGISLPAFHSPDYDLVVELGGSLHRVQVKTSRCLERGRYAVQLATYGGNQSWNGTVHRFHPSRCDLLFVLVSDGRRWLIPAHAIEAERGIRLGGPKYSEFEIDHAGAPAFAFGGALESNHSGGAPELESRAAL